MAKRTQRMFLSMRDNDFDWWKLVADFVFNVGKWVFTFWLAMDELVVKKSYEIFLGFPKGVNGPVSLAICHRAAYPHA